MTRIQTSKNHLIRTIALLFVIIIITMSVLFAGKTISKSLYDTADTATNKVITEITNLLSHDITAQFNSINFSLSSMARALSYIDSSEERLNYLKEMSLRKNNSIFGYAKQDGQLHVIDNNSTIDISRKEYFKNSINGSAASDVSTYNHNGKSLSGFVFSYPVCPAESDIPNSIICEFIDIVPFFNSLSLDTNSIQVVMCNNYNNIIVSTEYIKSDEDKSTKLTKLIKDDKLNKLLDDKTGSSKNVLVFYESNDSSQYIYRTSIINKWTLYASINPEMIYLNTSDYVLANTIVSFFVIIFILFAIITFTLPIIREESRKRVSEGRSMLLANVSHELRTPLNTIIGISKILSRSELTDGQIREVSYISDAGKNLLAMINDLLDFTKLQSNKYELIEDKYDLESLIYDMTTVATVRLNDKPVEFLVYISSYVPRHIIGDLLRVRQVINNIVTNAVKYTEKGQIIVTVDCDIIDETSLKLIISVSDTGIGIKKEDMKRLFDDFTRFDSTKNKAIEGSGLGMSIAMKFAELMEGSITVESTYGKGSTFTINLLQHITSTTTLIPEYSPKEPYDNILILEKSQILSNYYSRCLEDTLVNYDITDDNYEFSNLFNSKNYSFVLADSETISMMRIEFNNVDDSIHFISLVHNNSSTLKDGETLYIPLFSLQLYSYLSGQKSPIHNYSLGQSFMIHPMPEKHILIVDDNYMNLQVATGIMEPYHMQIDCAESGNEALKLVQQKPYDLVFMDHMMPVMDGEETLHAIRKLDIFNCQAMPIIVLTANASAGAHKMFIEMGFEDFIPKPLEIRTLHSLIYKWLKPENNEKEIEYLPEVDEIKDDNYEESGLIDFKEGLARIGSMPIYLKTLRNFCDTISKKRVVIPEAFSNDIKLFVIEVHGLKGVAAIVSANKLTNQSLELEMMGKSENIKGIEPLLDDYYENMIEAKMCAERFIEEHT